MDWILRKLRPQRPPPQSLRPELESEIRRSFEEAAADKEHFPATIDERILHVQAVLRHMEPAAQGTIVDLGSGKGRFAAIVRRCYPAAQVLCVDLAYSMLEAAPAECDRVCASMLALPLRTASVDGLYAIESLEHAVDIEGALAEMARVLVPGGRLFIIDKNAEHWGRLKTPEWERWFGREELEAMLRKSFRSVSSDYISYWEDVQPDGLFIAWSATK